MKVSIVMTYYNRPYQLTKTLESLKASQHKDFEVIVMDDNSELDAQDTDKYPFKVSVHKIKRRGWMNSVPLYNMGFAMALENKADVIIIQNAECYHQGDVISYASQVTDKNYLSFSCFSLNAENTFKEHDIHQLIRENDRNVTFDGDLGWYIHPVLRAAGFHFCSAVTAENLVKLNGFDERLAMGIAYDDNCLVHQIQCLGLRIDTPLNPFVVHQWHYNIKEPSDRMRSVIKNRLIFHKLRRVRFYKADHMFTKDLHR